MAKEQKETGRQITIPAQVVQSGNAFEKMGEAAGQMSSLVSQKASAVAAENAATAGEKAALEGTAPKDLALPVTPATKAFNDAVANVEANRMTISATQQIQEALVNHTNPATFNSNSPAEFRATVDGIIQGTLENARDETRGQITNKLQEVSANASIKMLQHAIEFDNKQTKTEFKTELSALEKAKRDAIVAGEDEQATAINLQIEQTLNNFGEINREIKQGLPEIKQRLEEQNKIDNVLGEYSKAASENKQAEFLADFLQNKQNLPFDTWQKASKELLQLDSTEKSLKQGIEAQEIQQVNNAIDNRSLNDVDDILDFPNLTVTQQLTAVNRLENRQQKDAKEQNTLLQAQADILRGTPAFITSDTKNKMFDFARGQFEQSTGKVATVFDMEQSILGENQFPVSGFQGIPLNTNVSKFDSQLTNLLTSNDPKQVLAAATIYNDMVNVKNKPDLVNLSGDALAVATEFNTLDTGGLNTDERLALAQRVSDSVINVKDPEKQQRIERFNREFRTNKNGKSKMDDVFKEIHGVKNQPGLTDAAFGVTKETYKINFLKTGSEESALEATKYEMRAWGQSKYFEQGAIQQVVPEKELNITQIGNTFDNQLRVKMQRFINKNKEDSDKGITDFAVEWQNPDKQNINLEGLTDEQKVFERLGEGRQPHPQVKVNGRDTEVFLMPTADSRLGERVQYALYYYDRFGQPQPLPDQSNPTGVSHFSPVGLERWAPEVFENKRSEELKQIANKIVKKRARQKWADTRDVGLFGRDPEQARDLFRQMFTIDAGQSEEVQNILRQKIQGEEEKTDTKEIATKADMSGIAANTGQ